MSYRIDEMTYWGGNPIAPCSEETAQDLIGKWEKIGKEWASKKKEIVLSILKGNDMEKKKMTKAEAFEWLKCKKVSVANREINNKVQSKLFACGVEWKYHGTDVCYYGDYLVINPEGFLCHCDGMGSDYGVVFSMKRLLPMTFFR